MRDRERLPYLAPHRVTKDFLPSPFFRRLVPIFQVPPVASEPSSSFFMTALNPAWPSALSLVSNLDTISLPP